MADDNDVVISLDIENCEIELDTIDENTNDTTPLLETNDENENNIILDDENCVICFDTINKNENYATTSLDGKFAKYCIDCLDKWSKVGKRGVVTTEPMTEYYIFKDGQYVETILLEEPLEKLICSDYSCYMVFVVCGLFILGILIYAIIDTIIYMNERDKLLNNYSYF